jgi:hypothetical protein
VIQIEQQPLDERIGQEIMKAMPRNWRGAVLTAERSGDDRSERYSIKLSPLKAEPGVAIASQDLQDAIRELYQLHKRHGTGMRVARYSVEPDGSEWRLVSEFEYDD